MAINLRILFSALLLSGCQTAKMRPTPDGRQVPARSFFQFFSYDYYCDGLPETNPQRVEEYLKSFGNEGWEVATTIIRDGQTVAICFQR